MNLFVILSKDFWLICIGVAAVNYLLSNRAGNSDQNRAVDRERRRHYLGWFWGLSAMPWLVVGFGQTVGGVPSIWAYFRPQDRNPYVWSFYASILALYIVVSYWVLFRDGARIAEELRLVKFNAPGTSGAVSAFWIKVMAIGSFPFFALWLWLAWHMNAPTIP